MKTEMYLMKYSLIVIAFFLLSSCQTNRQKKQDDDSDLSLKIDSIISGQKFNGVILVSADSMDIYSKAIGFSDLENETKLEVNHQFVIGSISKQITAVLVLREYEKGNLELDNSIGKYLTQIDQPWTKEVTTHHLLTHTHGIVDLNKPLEFEQGSQFHYSQLGYELLAHILEKVTQKSFEQLSTELF
ncbi:MAG: serine hydrolase domain-containing protein [Bacteroidia bacterium]